MGGHVNMMDDVLIANLPPELLRSSLRTLISQGSVTQQPFVQHIRQRFTESPPELTSPELLFPRDTELSPACTLYLATTRCVFSCKLAQQSLPYLVHFVDAIRVGEARWSEASDLHLALGKFGGDVVQALQAIKESKAEPTVQLQDELETLMKSLRACRDYCRRTNVPYPFTRAERPVRDIIGLMYPDSISDSHAESELGPQLSVKVSESHGVDIFALGPHEVPRLFNGFWQLSSPAWGSGTADTQEKALVQLVEQGLVAADMADHYGDAELIYGDFRTRLAPEAKDRVYAATKWCIFGPISNPVSSEWVLAAVKERSRRLNGRVELLQFHWYDYEAKEYLKILEELVNISKVHPELVSSIGLCNFDSEHVKEACEHLLKTTGSVGLVSNQVQFSLFDSRPIQQMCEVCTQYGLKLLTYGSFCGGFLSSRWLAQPSPEVYAASTQLTPSQRKYLDIIYNWGTWDQFQELLAVLSAVAGRHGVSLTNVATRWILQQPAVGAVIVGTRLGVSAHGDQNLAVFSFQLNETEVADINALALGKNGEKSMAMFQKLGDCGNEYRAMH